MTDTTPPADATPSRCTECGAIVPTDAPAGGCPGCLMDVGLDPEPPPGVPSSDSLSELFPELEIQSILGRGGMGAVFRARQTKLDRTIALKVLPPQPGERGVAFADRFQREARALARLDHPSIVRVYEFGEREGIYFLVMEYVDGVNLREAMLDGDIAPRQALAIVPQICDALQYAHDQGVVHRDIKPENVLLSKDGAVKVADFGLAKMLVGATEDATLTRAGQVMGTVHYMAPEQVESPASVDHRADIYSLGVVFYEMLTGELPVGHFEPPSHRARIDARLDEVVMRALERKRERRYQKASDVKTAVSGIDDPGSGAAVRPRQPVERARTSVPALLALLVLPAALLTAAVAGTMAHLASGSAHGTFIATSACIWIGGLLAALLGVAGFVDTRKPLRTGRWMAVVGLLSALVWAPALSSTAYYALDVQARQRQSLDERFLEDRERRARLWSPPTTGLPDSMRAVMPYDDPEFTVTADDATNVPSSYGAALKARLEYLLSAAANVGAARVGYDPNAERDDEQSSRFAMEFLGAAPTNLDRFRVTSAHVKSAMLRSGGLATAQHDGTEIRFEFEYDVVRLDWFLTKSPAAISRLASPGPPAIRVFNSNGTGVLGGEDSASVAQMRLRFSQWRGAALDDEQRRALLREVDREGPLVAAQGGLPFSRASDDAALRSGLRITEVRYMDPSEMEAVITAESDAWRVVFTMVRDHGDWWFGTGHVDFEAQTDEGR